MWLQAQAQRSHCAEVSVDTAANEIRLFPEGGQMQSSNHVPLIRSIFRQ